MSSRPETSRPGTSRPGTARPWTGQSSRAYSRPQTARPQTATSVRQESSFVIALIEGRGAGREVGMAALDKDTGRVNLIQVGYGFKSFFSTAHDRLVSWQTAQPTSKHFIRCTCTSLALSSYLIHSYPQPMQLLQEQRCPTPLLCFCNAFAKNLREYLSNP